MSNLSRRIAIVASVAFGAVLLLAGAASPVDTGHLDDVEGGICRETSGLPRAIAGAEQMRHESALARQRMGRGSEAEQRQAFLQFEITQRAAGAQDQIVADTRRQLLAYQAEYRRIRGGDFDVSVCDGPRVRVTHAMRAREQQERDWQASKQMMSQALADGEAYRQAIIACEDWKILQRPAAEVERWRPGYQAEARARFAAFSSDYQRRKGQAFDTRSCR